jgi:hypothetical protein
MWLSHFRFPLAFVCFRSSKFFCGGSETSAFMVVRIRQIGALRFSQQLFFPTFSPEYEYDPTISAILKTNLQYHMSVNSILSV